MSIFFFLVKNYIDLIKHNQIISSFSNPLNWFYVWVNIQSFQAFWGNWIDRVWFIWKENIFLLIWSIFDDFLSYNSWEVRMKICPDQKCLKSKMFFCVNHKTAILCKVFYWNNKTSGIDSIFFLSLCCFFQHFFLQFFIK